MFKTVGAVYECGMRDEAELVELDIKGKVLFETRREAARAAREYFRDHGLIEIKRSRDGSSLCARNWNLGMNGCAKIVEVN